MADKPPARLEVKGMTAADETKKGAEGAGRQCPAHGSSATSTTELGDPLKLIGDNASLVLALITSLGFLIGAISLLFLSYGVGIPITDLGVDLRGTITIAASSALFPILLCAVMAGLAQIVRRTARIRDSVQVGIQVAV